MNIKNVAIKVLSVFVLFYGINLHAAAPAPMPDGLNPNIGLTILPAHDREFMPSVRFSQDGTRIFTMSARQAMLDILIRSWYLTKESFGIQTMIRLNTSILREIFTEDIAIIQNAALSPDCKQIAAIFDSGMKFAIWNIGSEKPQITNSELKINSIAFSPDGKQIITLHPSIRSTSKKQYKTRITFMNSERSQTIDCRGIVSSIAISRDASKIACICSNISKPDEILVYNVQSKEYIHSFDSNQIIKSVAITSDCKQIITVGYRKQPSATLAESEKIINIWNVESKMCIHEFHAPIMPCQVAISPDDTQIAVSLDDGTIMVYTDTLAKSNKEIAPWTVVFQS